MINLPLKCEVNRVISKTTFYERLSLSSFIKQDFVDKIEKILWKYKISQDNLNIAKTDEVEEIEIFELVLKEKCDVKNIIKVILIKMQKILFMQIFMVDLNGLIII